MLRGRRKQSTVLTPQLPRLFELPLPDAAAAWKHRNVILDVAEVVSDGIERFEIPAITQRLVDSCAIQVAECASALLQAQPDASDSAVKQAWLDAFRPELLLAVRIGTKFGDLRREFTTASRDTVAVDLAVSYSSYLKTRGGPEPIRWFMNYTSRSAYYVALVDLDGGPASEVAGPLLVTLDDLAFTMQNSKRYDAVLEVVDAMWNSVVVEGNKPLNA